MKSCLYVGSVVHQRHDAVGHGFRKSLYLSYLDLEELDGTLAASWLCGRERWRWLRFRHEDHLPAARGDAPGRSLADAARDEVARETGRRPRGPVRLLTNLRCAGLAFNPVSFFYCFDEDGERLDAVVAEVSNTPWGERHCYVVDRSGDERPEMPKAFHVSPFQDMAQRYRWRIDTPGETLRVGIENLAPGGRLFHAVLSLERRPWTTRALGRVLVRHPIMPAEVVASIYWQAAKLFLQKRAPFHPHPPGAVEPTEITS